jgi:non-ribosomal peptide synthetase component F
VNRKTLAIVVELNIRLPDTHPPNMSALNAKISDPTNALSLFHGPQVPGLWDLNTGQLLDNQSQSYGEKVAIISKWQGVSWTYQSLRKESRRLGQKLLEGGVRPGDRVVILAGNCIEYIQLFFASTAIGAILVMINATFTAEEIIEAVDFVGMFCVFESFQ